MKTLGGLFDLEEDREKIAELEQQMTAPEFWDDPSGAQKIINEANALKERVQSFDKNEEDLENLEVPMN